MSLFLSSGRVKDNRKILFAKKRREFGANDAMLGPLPDMKESAIYFRELHRPFHLQLQQVSSIAGLSFCLALMIAFHRHWSQ